MENILAFGDSIAFGIGDNIDGGWAGRIARYFHHFDEFNCFYNLGIPGDTSSTLRKRFITEAEARVNDKSTIIIAIGTNDAFESVSIETFKENIDWLIKQAQEYTDNIIVIGLLKIDESKITSITNETIKQYNNTLKECCKNVPFLDLLKDDIELLKDGLHPSADGYEEIADIIKRFLIEHDIMHLNVSYGNDI